MSTRHYKIKFNRSKRTYTIRVYVGNQLLSKYRSYPQGKDYSEDWSQGDIYNFLRYSNDYYLVAYYGLR